MTDVCGCILQCFGKFYQIILMFFSSSAVEPFKEEYLSRAVLKKLIDHPGAIEEKTQSVEKEEAVFLFKRGVSVDYFMCIIQGQIEVVIGNESLVFVDGPFTVFGMQALFMEKGRAFIPDYEVKLLSDVQYLIIERALYRSAIRATQLERSERAPSHYEEFDEVFWNKKSAGKVPNVARTDESALLLVPSIDSKPTTNISDEVKFETPI